MFVRGLRGGRGVWRWIKPRELAVEPAEEAFAGMRGVGCASGRCVHRAEGGFGRLFNAAIMSRHLELAEPFFHDAVEVVQIVSEPQRGFRQAR